MRDWELDDIFRAVKRRIEELEDYIESFREDAKFQDYKNYRVPMQSFDKFIDYRVELVNIETQLKEII